MEFLRGRFEKVTGVLFGERGEWGALIRDSQKEARSFDRENGLSLKLGLTLDEEKVFFVMCCLAQEVALAREAERERKQTGKLEGLSKGGSRAVLSKELQGLQLGSVTSLCGEFDRICFGLTGEFIFDKGLAFNALSSSLSPQEREFREAKRAFLGAIADTSNLLYSKIKTPGRGQLAEGRPVDLAILCQQGKEKIAVERAKTTALLPPNSSFRAAFSRGKKER